MKRTLSILCICLAIIACQQKNSHSVHLKKVTTTKKVRTQPVVSNNCEYDNDVSTLGIGLVLAPQKFEVYSDSLLTQKFGAYDMFKDENKLNICSKFFKPDYDIMHFVCIGQTEKSYKVLVNYSEFKYLPKTKDYQFRTWSDYIMQSMGIRRLNPTNKKDSSIAQPPLRKTPDMNAETISIPKGYEMFCPMEVKGDWLKVNYDCFYNDEDNKHEGQPCQDYISECKNPVSGWIRWRNGNKLMINIFLTD